MQINSLDSIRNDIVNNGLLTKEEEKTLSSKIKQGDKAAREKLIASNYRLAVSIAKKYYRTGINFDDLLQESFIGLVKAVDRFDHTRGFKFNEEISESFGVTVDAVKNSAKSDTQYLSIDKSSDDDNKRSLLDKIDSIAISPEVSYENKQLLTIIKKHLKSLSPREEIVIRLRFGIQEDLYNITDFPRYEV